MTLKNTVDFFEGFFMEVPPFRQGHLHISPVNIDSIIKNAALFAEAEQLENSTWVTLHDKKALLTQSATQALDLALKQLKLTKDQEVWIVTTTGNTYISSCVTSTIVQHCGWSRSYSNKTAAILVNHEFGFCYQELAALKSYNLPIIEDAAYSMYSDNLEGTAGKIGTYVIYSLAKMFPVSSGGLLIANGLEQLPDSPLTPELQRYYQAVFSFYHSQQASIVTQRRQVFQIFSEAFEVLGLPARLQLGPRDVPGAFLFKAPQRDLNNLKNRLQSLGIECSVFYGEDAFYLPCHQRMQHKHVHYLATVTKSLLI
jgi:hypothetical protein